KQALTSNPVLAHYDPEAYTELHTDASAFGLGAVILQRVSTGQLHPIAYGSRTLTSAERNYSATERECLAIVWAVSKFRPYLHGRPFSVVTDHHSLCWLANLKDPVSRLARWSLKLQEYDMSIVYKNGSKHTDADALSRSPPSSAISITSVVEIRSLSDLSILQQADTFCMSILQGLQSSSPTAQQMRNHY